jgi:hypothetical protein
LIEIDAGNGSQDIDPPRRDAEVKDKVVLQKLLWRNDPDGGTKFCKTFEKVTVIRRTDRDEDIEVLRITRLSVKADRDSSDDEVPNLGGVECRQ